MNKQELISMWENDGFKVVKHREVEQEKHLWVLYAVYQPEGTEDYGRHFGMLLVIDKKTSKIIGHDLENQFDHSPSLGLESWFERHVREGIGEICV